MSDSEEPPIPRELLTFPVVLENCIAKLLLPRNLTVAEAERIYRYILALCIDGQNFADDRPL